MATSSAGTTSRDTIALINDKVLPLISTLDKKVDLLASDVQHLKDNTEERLDKSEEIVGMLRRELYGNGNPSEQPGLKSIVLSMKKWVDDRSSIEKAIVIGGVLTILGEIATFIFFAVKLAALS